MSTHTHLLYFYGDECPDCVEMMPLVKRLADEEGIVLTPYEVWNNPENDLLLEKYDTDNACGGIPFFIDTKTNKTLCGAVSYEELKAWATGK